MWKVWKEKWPFSCSFRIPQKGNVIPQVYQQAFTSSFLIIIIELWPFGEAWARRLWKMQKVEKKFWISLCRLM